MQINSKLNSKPYDYLYLTACLALTYLMFGLVVQPLHITMTIYLPNGGIVHKHRDLASLSHLSSQQLLITAARYLAINQNKKKTFTTVRLMVCSALAWIPASLVYLFDICVQNSLDSSVK